MILGILASLVLSSVSTAAPAVCSNLSAVTCTEGVREDGTGRTLVADSVSFAEKEFQRLEPKIRSTFKNLLSTPDGLKLTPLAMRSCRLNGLAECKNTKNLKCQKLLESCLSRLFKATEADPQLGTLYSDHKQSLVFDAESALELVQSPAYVRAAKSISSEIVNTVPQELKNKVETQLFPTVQKLLRQKINSLPIDVATRAKLEKLIATAKFGGVQCSKSSVDYSTKLAEALYPNAHYDGATHTFYICPAYLRYSTSEFDLASMIAHELAHAIDPCQLGGGADGGERRAMSEADTDKEIDDQYLRKNFLSCLRRSDSVGAKSFRPFNPPVASSDAMVGNGLNRLCQADQINEAVSDWFSAEVLADFIAIRKSASSPPLSQQQIQAGVANVLRSYCSSHFNQEGSADSHPTTTQRLNSIYSVQPKLRSLMGCSSDLPKKRYCDISNPDSLTGKSLPRSSTKSESVKIEAKQ